MNLYTDLYVVDAGLDQAPVVDMGNAPIGDGRTIHGVLTGDHSLNLSYSSGGGPGFFWWWIPVLSRDIRVKDIIVRERQIVIVGPGGCPAFPYSANTCMQRITTRYDHATWFKTAVDHAPFLTNTSY